MQAEDTKYRFQVGSTTYIKMPTNSKARNKLRKESLKFIKQYFPDVLADIRECAKASKANIGDIAILAITDAIVPLLEKRAKKHASI